MSDRPERGVLRAVRTRCGARHGGRMTRRNTGGFSLIELLVVILIIGVLLAILLPALKKVRLEGMKVVSLSNIRSLNQAGATYQNDQKGALPIVPNGVPVPTIINGWIPFSGWGKYASSFWKQSGGIFDVPPGRRPLNEYLVSQPLPTDLTDELRKSFQMPMLKDPSDKIGHQQQWNAYAPTFGTAIENADRLSCYDDVGTSYLLQVKWFFQTNRAVNSWTKAWRLGTERMRLADGHIAARMIWVNDEYCDITINQASSTAKIRNGYGDINKAVVGFLDGHVRYMKMIPGGESDPNSTNSPWLVPAFSNSEYTVVFPNLRAQ